MSDLKPVMVRLPPDLYEKLRASAFKMAIQPAVLARVLIKQQLEMEDDQDELENPSSAPPPTSAPTPSPAAPSSSPRRRSGNSKRRKNKKRGR